MRALDKKLKQMESSVEEGARLKTEFQKLERQMADLRTANSTLKTSLQEARRSAQTSAPLPGISTESAIALKQQLIVKVPLLAVMLFSKLYYIHLNINFTDHSIQRIRFTHFIC